MSSVVYAPILRVGQCARAALDAHGFAASSDPGRASSRNLLLDCRASRGTSGGSRRCLPKAQAKTLCSPIYGVFVPLSASLTTASIASSRALLPGEPRNLLRITPL